MAKPKRSAANPKDPQSIVEHLSEVQRILDERVEFGHPGNPLDDNSTDMAGTTHNGTLANMAGSWVELVVLQLDTNLACVHNMELAVVDPGQPNCRWMLWGFQHDGTGADGTSTVSVNYEDGTVGANSIELRFYASTRTVDVNHPLRVTLWFIPAVRGVAQQPIPPS